ncbi:MAG: hypothetical protein BWY85_02385 [Firmicutes bacterium ADurb.Bin506]|nr:MAG: hypothetical protein BWY85_02385 [Firmicutes bacterium ADurb.Bin506]
MQRSGCTRQHRFSHVLGIGERRSRRCCHHKRAPPSHRRRLRPERHGGVAESEGGYLCRGIEACCARARQSESALLPVLRTWLRHRHRRASVAHIAKPEVLRIGRVLGTRHLPLGLPCHARVRCGVRKADLGDWLREARSQHGRSRPLHRRRSALSRVRARRAGGIRHRPRQIHRRDARHRLACCPAHGCRPAEVHERARGQAS